MSLEDLLMEERSEDEGLEKSKRVSGKGIRNIEDHKYSVGFRVSHDVKSKNKNKDRGIKFSGKWGVLRCYTKTSPSSKCRGIFLAKYGQKTKECPVCKKTKILTKCNVLFAGDKEEARAYLKNKKTEMRK